MPSRVRQLTPQGLEIGEKLLWLSEETHDVTKPMRFILLIKIAALVIVMMFLGYHKLLLKSFSPYGNIIIFIVGGGYCNSRIYIFRQIFCQLQKDIKSFVFD